MTTNEKPGCLTALLGWLGLAPKPKQEEKETSFPYHQRDDFLSPAEISFYHVFRSIVGDKAVVRPKVSLGDLFYATTGDYGQNRSWMNRIDRKHVDFQIAIPGVWRPGWRWSWTTGGTRRPGGAKMDEPTSSWLPRRMILRSADGVAFNQLPPIRRSLPELTPIPLTSYNKIVIL